MKEWLAKNLPAYAAVIDLKEPIRQPRYYDFNVFSVKKAREKLDYMHVNPVRKGLVVRAEDWLYGSGPWYFLKRPVGVEIAVLS